jgi:hypothetical protein
MQQFPTQTDHRGAWPIKHEVKHRNRVRDHGAREVGRQMASRFQRGGSGVEPDCRIS